MINPTIDEEIHVQSSNADLGSALTQHCRERLVGLGRRYFGKITTANAHFRHEGQAYAVSLRFKAGGLHSYAAESTHRNPYRAFNDACEKVAKQLRRTKRMLREDKAHRPEKDPGMIGRELNSQQPAIEILRLITEGPRANMRSEAESYERQVSWRHAAE